MEGVEEATALLASLEVSSALPGEQGWPQAAVEEECGREPLEEEEMEEDVEEMEEDEEEGEIDFGLEDVEEEEHLPREYEEEEDENEQEGAAAVAGLEFPVERFGPLFWSHVDSFLRNFRNNKHVLFRPHADRLMAGGHSQAPSDPGEGPVPPQEQEDLGEGGQVLQGLDSAADFKLGYFSRQLLTPKSASFCPNDEGEDQYENSDEEEEDGNEKPGEGLEMDVVSAKGSSGSSQTPVPCAADVSAVPTPTLQSRGQQRLVSATLSGRHLPRRRHCRTIPVWHVSPAMSATEEHDWMPGGPDRAGGGAGRDPSLLGVQASASEGMEGVEEATALLASLEVSRALPGEQGWPQAAVEEECGREPLEEEEMEEDVEAMEEDEEEGEIDFEVEDVEEEAHLSGEGEEGEDTEDEDENEQEGAAAVKGLGFSVETFGPLFWSQVDSILCNFHTNTHVLFRPPTDGLMAGGCSPPPSDPGEGPVPPQEQEDLGEGDRGLQGLDSAADFKLGYFPCQLLTPMSASFCPNDEGEDEYETFDEEEEDENEKPEEL
ncbi:hypothetical protein JEQ12_020585 [Ovis aries]|uniref:Uncharacterized protein n=3 Tax=Ovis TaxID=9935 RepID=A0A835ZMW9_SHEEP|nr:hypothetical protein JEQ12_020585 [Ovis aries]